MNRHYISLWLLLVVGLAAIIIYSCGETVKIGDTEIRSSGIADRLTAEREAEPTEERIADNGEIKSVETDTASHTILFIGDSTLDNLNPAMAAYAHHNGHKLYSVIWYSSTSEYWGNSDTLGVYMRQFKPTYIILSLGANELFVTNIAEKRTKYMKSLLRQIGDIPYLWIGPPNWKPDTGINDMIQANTRPGSYFKTDGMVLERGRDGAHPTREAARQWLDSVARWMPSHCSHPIKMETPPSGYESRPDRVVVLQPLH